jgi:hypothetical protein
MMRRIPDAGFCCDDPGSATHRFALHRIRETHHFRAPDAARREVPRCWAGAIPGTNHAAA